MNDARAKGGSAIDSRQLRNCHNGQQNPINADDVDVIDVIDVIGIKYKE